jgi:hypothetical protein
MKLPEKVFYYHYKHDPKQSINNYSYEVVGVAMHTESRELTVLYKPLYKNTFLSPADYCARPLDMFLEDVVINGIKTPRFTKIDDVDIIQQILKASKER